MIWNSAVPLRLVAVVVVATIVVLWLHRIGRGDAASPRRVIPALPAASPVETLGFRVAASAGPVWVIGRGQPVPAAAAPVFEVFADGGVALRRPPMLATVPGGGAANAAVVLPGGSFEALDPAARGSALELIGLLCIERPLPSSAVRVMGLEASPRQVAAWFAWLP